MMLNEDAENMDTMAELPKLNANGQNLSEYLVKYKPMVNYKSKNTELLQMNINLIKRRQLPHVTKSLTQKDQIQ
jgi:hypothetical protein